MHLGILTDRNIARDEGRYWTRTTDGRLITALRARCEAVTIAAGTAPERKRSHDFDLSQYDVTVLEGPYVSQIATGVFKTGATRRVLRELERRCDAVLVQLPIAAVTALAQVDKPRVYQVASDISTIVQTSSYYRGVKRAAAVALARFIDRRQRRLIHDPRARTVTHGSSLFEHYGVTRGAAVVSSSIRRDEILSVPRSRPADAPFRILYVGYLRHEKGIDILLEAFERIVATLPEVELEIVGATDLTEHGVTQTLQNAAQRPTGRGTIRLRGHLEIGRELFQCFADADVCVLPSRSEGTPRVLIEARAFGCPVIGTRVGGIVDSIDDRRDGLLIPPGDAEALTDAVLEMARNSAFRETLISGGIQRARRTTVDDFAEAVMREVRLAVGEENLASELNVRNHRSIPN